MQGFNMGRYRPPPDQDSHPPPPPRRPKTKNRKDANSSSSSQTVRFEMPFAVWCETCPKPTIIGQGVRFNAEKRRVGSYFSTPLWSFRFRHGDCGGWLEIRTDPKNTAYVVFSGGTKRCLDHDTLLSSTTESSLLREEKRSTAFSALERTIEHRQQLRRADERILDLMHSSARYWNDPYAQNQRLRNAFRPGRLRRQHDAASADRLRDAIGLAFDILPADDDQDEDDARQASLVSFHQHQNHHHHDADALEKPLFTPPTTDPPKRPIHPVSHSTSSSSSTRAGLVSELAAKTRLAHDPFLRSQPRLRGVKRKRQPPPAKSTAMPSAALVQYDSD